MTRHQDTVPVQCERLFQRMRPVRFWLILSAVIVILLFFRRPGALLLPSIYFEDGIVYYAQQLHSGSVLTVFQPYDVGYYVLAPRLVAYLAWRLPASWAPYLFNLSGFLIGAAACSFFCLPRHRPIIASDALRAWLCVLFAITLDSKEALATATNCSWYLGIPVILLALNPLAAGTRWQQAGGFAFGILLGMSTPLVVLPVPIALWQFVRKRAARPFLAGLIIASAAQVIIHVIVAPSQKMDLSPIAFVTALLVTAAHRVVMSSMLGLEPAFHLMGHKVELAPLLALAFLEGVNLYLLFRGGRRGRWQALLCLYVLTAGAALSLTGKGFVSTFQHIGDNVPYGGTRYFFMSSCAFAVLVGAAIEQGLGFRRAGWKTEAAKVLLLMLLFGCAVDWNFRIPNGDDPHWALSAPRIDAWKRAKAAGAATERVVIPLSGPEWKIDLPAGQ